LISLLRAQIKLYCSAVKLNRSWKHSAGM